MVPETLCIIAGNGRYPFEMAAGARSAGVRRVVAVAFHGETNPDLAAHVDEIAWLRVGQLGGMLGAAETFGARAAVMAGQIAPRNLFDLRPDWKALLVLASVKKRNAESLFGAIAAELSAVGVSLLPATSFMERSLAPAGHFAGPRPKPRHEEDARYGFEIAKEVSRLDIGQTVLVKNGTVLAVEAFEGTNETIQRGGALGRGDAIVVKVSKPKQDLRFDVPVIGPVTVETAKAAGVRVIGVEAGGTLLLERERLFALANELKVTLIGL
jgi:DUF1009 family protein